ncbi:EamA family transporter [Zavarzinella formosa]|uniref:EamA family transporter n=1 Tax=Zavarzinella formosa TaxID=360055 RepID=UPI0002F6419B|nr:EamA family transporter [Zavarzinella formosa]
MTWDVAIPVLFAALLHAGWNALVRAGTDRVLDTARIAAGAALVSAPALVFLPLPAAESLPFLLASGIVHVGYFTMVAVTYRVGDLSLVYPLMRGTAPGLTAICAALLLGEWPRELGWSGVFLIASGVLLLAFGARASAGRKLAPVGLALATAAIVVLYTMVDGVGARRSGNAFSYTGWMLIITVLGFSPAAFFIRRRRETVTSGRWWQIGLFGGGSSFASYALALWAMTRADIALVAALRETSILFGTLIAVLVLRERVSRWRVLAVALVEAGAVAIKCS